MSKKVLISLHDVTPFHFSRVRKAEELLTHWGVSKLSYLFIPDYHGKNQQLEKNILSTFKQWTVEKRFFDVQWLLHGYYHMETLHGESKLNNQYRLSPGEQLKRKILTANEGEFLSLSPTEIQVRIQEGKSVFKSFFNCYPTGFVGPAWLFNKHLIPILKDQQFSFTEDHSCIYLLQTDETISTPVITWATRSPLRKSISLIGCPILNRWWSGKDLVRIALHPFDFDYSDVINSIENIIKIVLDNRKPILYNEL